jgi:hypothetical protein
MANDSNALKFSTNPASVNRGVGVLPIVVFFGTTEAVFFEMTKSLVQSGFKPMLAKTPAQVAQLLADPAFRMGVVMDDRLPDPLKLIQIGKKVSKALWILISKERSNAFRAMALGGLKVDALFEYPLAPALIVSKIRHLNANFEAQALERLSVSRKNDLRIFPKDLPSLGQQHLGFEALPSGDFRTHRPSWPNLSAELYKKAAGNSLVIQTLLDEALNKVVRDLKQFSRVSIVSFGVDQPFVEGDPMEFVILSSSDLIDRKLKQQSRKTSEYPELMEAFRSGQALVVKNIRESALFTPMMGKLEKVGTFSLAAIPLLQGTRPFGVIKARMKDANSEMALSVLADLHDYSRELSKFALQSSFFQRIYRGFYTKKSR